MFAGQYLEAIAAVGRIVWLRYCYSGVNLHLLS